MRNHETTSASTSRKPNAEPSAKYGTSVMGLPEENRQHDVGRREAAGKESAHRQERGWLQIGKTAYRVSRRASAGVGRAESNEEPADDDGGEAFDSEQTGPGKDFVRREAGEIGQPQSVERVDCRRRQRQGERRGQLPGGRGANEDPRQECEVPSADL